MKNFSPSSTMLTMVILAFLILTACSQQSPNVDIVNRMYADVAAGDVPSFLAAMDDQIEWNEAENFPYADGNPYIGPDAVVNGVFARLGADWEYFNVVDLTVMEMADNMVLATGRYDAQYKESGNKMYAQCAHLWTFRDGKVVNFQQYTDTEQAIRTMRPGLGLTYDEIEGKPLDFHFGSFNIQITYVSDTEHTFKYADSDVSGTVEMETIHVDPYSTHNTWKEDDGKIWSSFNDFQKGLVTVFNVDPEGKIERMNGTISLPE